MNDYIMDISKKIDYIFLDKNSDENKLKARIKEILDISYDYCCLNESIDDFMTIWAIYINKSFYNRANSGMLIVDDLKINDEDNKKYLFFVQNGILTQEYHYFEKASKLIPKYSISHLYLLVKSMINYIYYLSDSSDEVLLNNSRKDMIYNFDMLSEEYRDYVFGVSRFIKDNVDCFFDDNVLPHFSTKSDTDGIHSICYSWCEALYNCCRFGNLTGINNILKTINEEMKDMLPHEYHKISKKFIEGNTFGYDLNLQDDRCMYLHINNNICERDLSQIVRNGLIKCEKLNYEKDCIIDEFSHKYSNMKSTTLQTIGEALLRAESPTLKDLGRLTMNEVSIKENLSKEIELLKIRFQETPEYVVSKIRDSITEDNENIKIKDIISDSLKRCFMTLLYDESKEGRALNKLFFNSEKSEYESLKDEMMDSFESFVLCGYGRYSVIEWLSEINYFAVKVSISDFWNDIKFEPDSYASLMFTGWIAELFLNAFKYSDKNYPVIFDLNETEDKIVIKLTNIMNQKNNNISLGSNKGIKSIREYIKYLNKAVHCNADYNVLTNQSGNEFSTTLFLYKKIFKGTW